MKNLLLFAISFLFLTSKVQAAELDNLQLFYRCYQHLTQTFPEANNPALLLVKNNNKNAIDACMENVFDLAQLGSNGLMTNPNNQIARDVISNFQNLHSSWFTHKDLQLLAVTGFSSFPPFDFYESSTAANYITKSLFDEGTPANYILTADHHLRAKRHLGVPAYADFFSSRFVSQASDLFINGPNLFLEKGKITGFQEFTAPQDINYPYSFSFKSGSLVRDINGLLPVFAHYGGGAMGTVQYITSSVDEDYTYEIDGGVEIPRKWGESVYNDFLCRELPHVRSVDVTSYTDLNHELPFRKFNTCTRCHASMDQLTGLIRGFNVREIRHREYIPAEDRNITKAGSWEFTLKHHEKDPRIGTAYPPADPFPAPLAESVPEWPGSTDADYQKRPSHGRLFFRDYKGSLVNEKVTGLDNLGLKLSQRLDPYLCLTKRYYKYMTGIDVDIRDPDPAEGLAEATSDPQRQKLISLTQSYAGSPIGSGAQSLRSLIEAIMRHPDYKQSNYGVTNE